MATDPKTVTLRFRVTPEEAAEIRTRAIGMDLSKYLRLRALAQPLTAEEASPVERAILSDPVKRTEPVTMFKEDRPVTEAEVKALAAQLYSRGKTSRNARLEAEQQLGLR